MPDSGCAAAPGAGGAAVSRITWACETGVPEVVMITPETDANCSSASAGAVCGSGMAKKGSNRRALASGMATGGGGAIRKVAGAAAAAGGRTRAAPRPESARPAP